MGMEVAVLLLGGFFALGAEGACDSVTCEEVCAPADATSGVDCTAGYVAGTWDRPSTTCPEGCMLKNWVAKSPSARVADGNTLEECCDDGSYQSYQTCDVNGDGSANYKDYLPEYKGLAVAKEWIAKSATDDKTCRCTYTENSLNGVFTFEQLQNGGVVCYIIGVIYMFIALAIVCDEFFVPALDVMVDKLGISDDVAGATFMAAGGSAPELFTSLIGTFQQSSVGFGTIVGSAVFNVLFVIGMCSLFSTPEPGKKGLQLTWWPLARDCSYYALSLLVLALFFGAIADHPDARLTDEAATWVGAPGGPNDGVRFRGSADNEVATIHIWEAAILFVMYVGYVLVMKNNENLRSKFDKPKTDASPGETEAMVEEGTPDPEEGTPGQSKGAVLVPTTTRRRQGFAGFRAGMLDLLVNNRVVDTAAVNAVLSIKGNVEDTFDSLDTSKDGYIDKTELGKLLQQLGDTADDDIDKLHADIKKACKGTWDGTREAEISKEEFTMWYLYSEHRVAKDLERCFNDKDIDKDGTLSKNEMAAVVKELNGPMSEEEVEKIWAELDTDQSGSVDKKEFSAWYKNSSGCEERLEQLKQDEAEEGISLCPLPNSCGAKIKYFIVFPLVALMYFSMPDVRKEKYQKYFVFTFFMAIVWVGVYSYLMVWWATEVGCAFGIPDAVMGLTFLAAGTSVPDLLTSVIVARQGKGDMAVSSSIGSNIFDVLVGLPFPWLVYCIVKGVTDLETKDGMVGGFYVRVSAPTLFMSLLILFAMIALVIGTIILSKWQLTKPLGATMFVFYFLFVIQDLARTFEWV